MSTDHDAWIGQVVEEALDPDLQICDPHHHLWLDTGHTGRPYPLDAFQADTAAGHNIVRSVFLECGAGYHTDGPEHLRPVGETEWVASLAEGSAGTGTEIAGIVGTADVTRGAAVAEVLDAHEQAGGGRFRGIRYITAHDDHPPLAMGNSPDVMSDPAYLEGVRTVHRLGWSYDVMVYHPQLPQLVEVARACPDGVIVVDHLGAPLGVGPYKDRRDEIIAWWKEQMAELATCPNVVLKVGGIGMPMYGLRWDRQERPPTSEELAEPWRDPILFCIEAFGADRCMFESNYPVDGRGAGYVVLWNAFKRIAADASDDERRDLFHDCAARAYQLPTLA